MSKHQTVQEQFEIYFPPPPKEPKKFSSREELILLPSRYQNDQDLICSTSERQFL